MFRMCITRDGLPEVMSIRAFDWLLAGTFVCGVQAICRIPSSFPYKKEAIEEGERENAKKKN